LVAKQKQELDRLHKEVAALKAKATKPSDGHTGGSGTGGGQPKSGKEAESANEWDFTVEQLQAQRKLLKGQGKADEHPAVQALTQQIELQKKAAADKKPSHQKLQAAEKLVATKQRDKEHAKSEVESLRAKLHAAESKLAAAEDAVTAAVAARDQLVAVLASAPPPAPVPGPDPLIPDVADEVCKAELGLDRAQLQTLFAKLAALKASAEEAAGREAAAAMAAAAAGPVAAASPAAKAAEASASNGGGGAPRPQGKRDLSTAVSPAPSGMQTPAEEPDPKKAK
jgi:DNA repair exonuclease SbcCD ATPase subunit